MLLRLLNVLTGKLPRSIIYLFAVTWLSSCGISFFDSSTSGSGGYPEAPASQQERLLIPEGGTNQSASNAIEQLLNDAKAALQNQNYERAAAHTERVIRIAPDDARGYFVLAQISYYQHQEALSHSLLAKARSLAGDDPALLAAIERFASNNL